jgi:hypothetical protein
VPRSNYHGPFIVMEGHDGRTEPLRSQHWLGTTTCQTRASYDSAGSRLPSLYSSAFEELNTRVTTRVSAVAGQCQSQVAGVRSR